MANTNELETQLRLVGITDPSVVQSINEAVEETQRLNKKSGKNFKEIAKKAAAAAKVVGAAFADAAVAAAKHMLTLENESTNAFKIIRAQTGATGEEFKALKEDMGAVMRQVPEDMDVIASTMGAWNSATGATGETLQQVTKQTADLARLVGEDSAALANSASKSFAAFDLGAEDASYAMQLLYNATQEANLPTGEYLDLLTEFSPALKALNMSYAESIGFIGKMHKEGYKADKMLDGLKTAMQDFATNGKDPSEGINNLISSIQNAETEADAAKKAMEGFGSEAGAAMAEAIRSGAFDVSEFIDDIINNGSDISIDASEFMTIEETFKMLKNQMDQELLPLMDPFKEAVLSIVPAVKSLIPLVTTIVNTLVNGNLLGTVAAIVDFVSEIINTVMRGGVSDLLEGLLNSLMSLINMLLPPILDIIKQIMPLVDDIITMVADTVIPLLEPLFEMIIQPVMLLVKTLLPPIIKIIKNILNALKPFLQLITKIAKAIIGLNLEYLTHTFETIGIVVSGLVDIFGVVIESITNHVKNLYQKINQIFDKVINFLKPIGEEFKTRLAAFRTSLKGFVDFVKGGFKNAWSSAWEGIKNKFSEIWASLVGAVKGPINIVIGMINKVFDKINGLKISLPDALGGDLGFNIPKIPLLAKGGITKGVSIAGEAGPEMVIPLRSNRPRALNLLDQAAGILGANTETNNNNSNSKIVYSPSYNIVGGSSESIEDIKRKDLARFKEFKEKIDREEERIRFVKPKFA